MRVTSHVHPTGPDHRARIPANRVVLPALKARSLPALLAQQALERHDHPALRDAVGDLTYGELYLQARQVAAGLRSAGVGQDDPVLVMVGNNRQHVLAWLGISFAGAVEVPVNTAAFGRTLRHVVEDTGATTLILEAPFIDNLAALEGLSKLETVVICGDAEPQYASLSQYRCLRFETLCAHPPLAPEQVQRSGWDAMAIMYTSGTTGPSKGVCITHAHAYTHCAPSDIGGVEPDDVALVSLPLFHIGGQWNGLYQAWIAGATAALLDRFSASRFWEDARRYGATYTTLLGAQASFLMRQPPRDVDTRHAIRHLTMLPLIDNVDAFRERFGIAGVRTGYGISEGSSPIGAGYNQASPGACGWLKPLYEARLVDEFDCEVPCGQVGELVLRSKEPWILMTGYHGLPEKTAEAMRNQWLHTGDLFRQDSSGQFYFTDRAKDSIRRRGENISSYELEREACCHPAVTEAAAVAVKSEHTEEEIMIFAIAKSGMTLLAADLHAFLTARLPRYMAPRYVELVEDLPRTPTNRVQKHLLRAQGVTARTWDAQEHGVGQ
ncbi:MAG: AMP-binding protein [Pigmentiphaga sp.]